MNVAICANASSSASFVDRLLEERDRAGPERVLLAVSSTPVMMCTGMCRVVRVVLELVEHGPAVHPGSVDVEHDRVGLVLVREREPGVAASATSP